MSHNNHDHTGQFPDRRSVLGGAGAIAGFAFLRSALPASLANASASLDAGTPLIVVFLRGGADALSWVAPVTDQHYINRRPTIKIPAPPLVASDPRWLEFNRRLALPQAALNTGVPGVNLVTPYQNGDLAFLVGTGLTCPPSPATCGNTKSHFEMMNYLETGTTPGTPINLSGWFARYLNTLGSGTALRGLSHGTVLPRSLGGTTGVIPVRDVQDFPFPGRAVSLVPRKQTLVALNVTSTEPTLAYKQVAGSLVDAQQVLSGVPWTNDPNFPNTPFGQSLRKTADMLNFGLSLEAVHIDYGGWDHHSDEGPNPPVGPADPRQFYDKAVDVSRSLGAFYSAMGGNSGAERYRMIIVSEFGRRVFENGDKGTDHGTGGVSIFMGAGIRNGKFNKAVGFPKFTPPSSTPGTGLLAPGVLVFPNTNEEDLATTLDIRDVIGEILVNGQGVPLNQVFSGAPTAVFPNRLPPTNWIGIVG